VSASGAWIPGATHSRGADVRSAPPHSPSLPAQAEGETIIQQGSGAAAFFVIDSGEATVLVDGKEQRVLKPGDHFGEMALIDAGTRTATVLASSDLACSGVTFWDFRPLVEENGVIGWKLLQSLIEIYRSERQQ